MGLSIELISQFVKATNDQKKTKSETTVYGTMVEVDGTMFVRLDGSETLTPVTSTANTKPGERVTVMIKNHTATVTGNISSPAARLGDVKGLEDAADKIEEFEIVLAQKVDTAELNVEKGRIDNLLADNVLIRESLAASEADIDKLQASSLTVTDELIAAEAEIEKLKTDKIDAEIAEATFATIKDLEATDADIHNLNATYGEFVSATTERLDAAEADIKDLDAVRATVESLDTTYANIDFSNIGKAAIEKFFSKSGIIEDVVVGDGTVTGKLVGVTIAGDLIEGNTVVAEKLVIKGEDGLYYKLNTDGVTTEAEQTDYNSLNGSVIRAKSVTADKISVTDLVAFGATIAGLNIADGALYSGVKTSVDNTAIGIYMDKHGQLAIGDANNYIKYYTDSNGYRRLVISAESIVLGTGSRNIETALDDVETTINNLEIGGRNLLLNSDFYGLTSNAAITYDQSERMVTFTSDILGDIKGVYPTLSEYGLSNLRGSTITFSGEYMITTELEYGTTNPWVGFQLGVKRDSTTGGNSQYLNWLGGKGVGSDVTDGWVKVTKTYTITDYDFTSASVSVLFRDVIGSIKFRNLKIEFGNKPSDWTLAPEDMATSNEVKNAQTSADEARSAADEADARAANAETLIAQLSDSISMLVTDGNGTSLMTQTEDGWMFSTAEIQSSVNRVSENLESLAAETGNVEHSVEVLQQAVNDLGEIAEYVKIGTYEDEPCIELGEGDSDFKLLITNTRIMFMEGTGVPAYFTNQSMHIKKAVIEDELQQGGFVWKARSNGNLGLVWKGVTE